METRQTAFVTGGASGIGRATVMRLVEDGFRVVAIDRNEHAAARVVDDVAQAGGLVVGQVADVCDRKAIAALLDAESRVDVMVCAAAIGPLLDRRVAGDAGPQGHARRPGVAPESALQRDPQDARCGGTHGEDRHDACRW